MAELGQAARAHRFDVAPNPCVGAAVLSRSRVVGRGFHRAFGEEHAELLALAAAEASGVPAEEWDTLVVTLEPCCSRGKTPPCTDAVLRSGIGRVVVGELDPDPRHRGQGLERLREAGVAVERVEGAAPLSAVAPHFLRWTSFERLRRPRPWTVAKWAQTLSGQLTPPEDVGDGRWISGPESRAEVQVLRAHVDAVVTGVGTVLGDDPRLAPRGVRAVGRPALRVVLDSYLRTPPAARLLASEADGAGEVVVLSLAGFDAGRARALRDAGARVVGLRGTDRHRIDLRVVQGWLWEQGVRRALVEAGPRLLSSYLESGFVDQLRVVTGSVRGGRGESLGSWLARAKLLERRERECGSDAVLEGFLASE